MSTYSVVTRPNVQTVVKWEGDNLQEVVLSLPQSYQQGFAVEDGTNNLLYVDGGQSFPIGTYILFSGGIIGILEEQFSQYQVVNGPNIDFVFADQPAS